MAADRPDIPADILGLLYELSAFLDGLNRNAGVRLEVDWPEDEFQAVKERLDRVLYPLAFTDEVPSR